MAARIGWYADEMKANPALDDAIEQDITVDPFLPIADNYFDFVIMPAMFQVRSALVVISQVIEL